jgi:hypothetical protein
MYGYADSIPIQFKLFAFVVLPMESIGYYAEIAIRIERTAAPGSSASTTARMTATP